MTDNTNIPQDENQIIAERRAKLARLRESGNAFPNDFRRKDSNTIVFDVPVAAGKQSVVTYTARVRG